MRKPADEIRADALIGVKFAVDLGIWTLAAFLSFPLRLTDPWVDLSTTVIMFVAIGIPIKAIVIWAFGLPLQAWRQSTVHDLLRLATAVAAGTAIMFSVGLVLHGTHGFPRTAPLIGGILALLGMGGARLATRLLKERAVRAGTAARSVLLIGAGDAGARMARELRRHPRTGLAPVGFLDDDRTKRRLKVAGLPVLGAIDDMPRVAAERGVADVLITMPSASGSRTRRVVDLATTVGLSCRILPGITEILVEGDVDVSRIRDVQVEDLLRRRPVELDLTAEGDYIGGRTVLVTGAGGSIGSELVRQVARLGPSSLILLGRGENSLHSIQQELRSILPTLDATVVVGDVRDRTKLDEVMRGLRVDVVFHTAAYKHVPMLEHNPDEAVLNNIGGTLNVARSALEAGVERLVNVSTDKAVAPVSMLGVTKAIAEQIVLAAAAEAGPDQVLVSVRFGNVLGSRGSVVPIFQEQIRVGGPVTLTHPEMTRYFMTIPEASRLVMQAGSFSANGAVYVLDMGTPVRIEDLAKDMIRLSGFDEDEIEIVYTGLRPGEKIAEELFTEQERTTATRYEQILVARSEPIPAIDLMTQVDRLLEAAGSRNWPDMQSRLDDLVPGFRMGNLGNLRVLAL